MRIILFVMTLSVLFIKAGLCLPYTTTLLDSGSPGFTSTMALAIDRNNNVAGTAGYPTTAVIWGADGMIKPFLPQFGLSVTMAMNNLGSVAGLFYDDSNLQHGYVWNKETGLVDLGTIGGISAMNDNGLVVGKYLSGTHFIWSQSDGFRPIAGISPYHYVYDINNPGTVVGSSVDSIGDESYAFTWSEVEGTTIIAENAEAFAVNNNGDVVGVLNDTKQMFIWSSGQMLTVSIADSYNWVRATAISDTGAVVGWLSPLDGPTRAFAWDSQSGFTILGEGFAYDINDQGQIAGKLLVSQNVNGSDIYRAVVWAPVPEPATLVTLACGLVGMAGVVRRKTKQ